jgi:chromosome segregation ATPase
MQRSKSITDWKESNKGFLKLGWRFRRLHPNYLKLVMQEREHQIELLQGEWLQLAFRVEHMEVQLWKTQQEVEQQPQKLQEKMEKIVLEHNNVRATLHKCTTECTNIFREVSDWMGIIARRNQSLKDVHTKIHVLNEEVVAMMDPLEQQQKFDQIQQAYNELNSLFEAQSIAKKELHDF